MTISSRQKQLVQSQESANLWTVPSHRKEAATLQPSGHTTAAHAMLHLEISAKLQGCQPPATALSTTDDRQG